MSPKPFIRIVTRISRAAVGTTMIMLFTVLFYFFSIIGIITSLYAIYIETKWQEDHDYVALCDISATVACSKVLTSEYSHLLSAFNIVSKGSIFDRPNAQLGLLFYIIVMLVESFIPSYRHYKDDILLLFTVIGVSISAILSYILNTNLHDVCIICYTTYICNISLFLLVSYRTYSHNDALKKRK